MKYLVEIKSPKVRDRLMVIAGSKGKVGKAESMPNFLIVTTDEPIEALINCTGVLAVEEDSQNEVSGMVDQDERQAGDCLGYLTQEAATQTISQGLVLISILWIRVSEGRTASLRAGLGNCIHLMAFPIQLMALNHLHTVHLLRGVRLALYTGQLKRPQ